LLTAAKETTGASKVYCASDVPLIETRLVIRARSLYFDAVRLGVAAAIVVADVQEVVRNGCSPSEMLTVGVCEAAPKFRPEIVTEAAIVLTILR
jgi:hypothetical protein